MMEYKCLMCEFEVPWQRLSNKVIRDCEKGNRIKCSLDSVAKDVDDDNVTIGDGSHTLFQKLCDRNAYLNRPFKKPSNALRESTSPKQVKLQINRTSGCSDWDPLLSKDDVDMLQEKKTLLNNSVEFTLDTIQLLEDTYALQRHFINISDSVNSIKKQWPVLFLQEGTFWHFKKLMGKSVDDLESMFLSKIDKILQFAIKKKYIQNLPEGLKNKMMVSLKTVATFLGDDLSTLITEAGKSENFKTEDVPTTAPCIVYLKDTENYTLYIEKEETTITESLMAGIKITFAYYYNFNLVYPKRCSGVLEFIQKYFMKIHPDKGSRNKNKRSGKILSLINQLRNM